MEGVYNAFDKMYPTLDNGKTSGTHACSAPQASIAQTHVFFRILADIDRRVDYFASVRAITTRTARVLWSIQHRPSRKKTGFKKSSLELKKKKKEKEQSM